MVGHTGFWPAVIKAVETVDQCVERVVTVALENNYTVFLTADHGNADYMNYFLLRHMLIELINHAKL